MLACRGLCYDDWRIAAMEINITIDGEYEGCPEADWFQCVIRQVLDAQNASSNAEIGLLITGQERVQELNRAYRGEDRPTDVLAFYMTSEEEKREGESERFVVAPDGFAHLGEVVISYPQAVIQAQERGHATGKELAILIIHGVLHLLGYDHERPEQKREMADIEPAILHKLLINLEGKRDE